MILLNIPKSNIKINNEGTSVYDSNNNDITSKIVINNFAIIEISGIPVRKPLIWFKHLSILNIDLPEQFKYEIENLYFVKYKPFGISKDYHWLPLFKKPVELIINNITYRLVARYPKYLVSSKGDVFSLFYNRLLRYPLVIDGEYVRYNIRDPFKDKVIISAHKLTALSWVNNDDYVNKNIIDHKDDDKLNNKKNNLQWVSNKYNISKNHYKEIHHVYIVRNIETHNINEFYSMKDISKFIGRGSIDKSATKLHQGKVWSGKNGHFEIYFKSKFIYWTHDSISSINKTYLVKHLGKKIYFNRAVEIRKYFKLNYKQAGNNSKQILNNLILNYPGIEVEVLMSNKVTSVREAKNLETGKVVRSKSLKEFIKLTGLPKHIVVSYLYRSLVYRPYDNWLIRYETTEPWCDELNALENAFNAPKKIIAKINNTKIISFDSINKAVSFFKKDGKTIKKRIKDKKPLCFKNKKYFLEYTVPLVSNC